jgi:threonylcarbamoyladenosine tRNA methylthiotransferase MtaB
MVVYFVTFGCKVNLTETEHLKTLYSDKGYMVSNNESDADLFVINSCTVTDTADCKLMKTIRRLRKNYPKAKIAVTGCFVTANPDITAARLGVDDILPKNNITKDKYEDFSVTHFTGNTRAFLKIQDGCNMNCTYCIIPRSRGHFRSKPIESVKKDASVLCANGYKEIVLTGINLAFYGIEYKLRLIDAIEAINENAPGVRIRLGSLEPEMITDGDIKRMTAIKGLCPQFHLSLQSACDETLRRMNRHYNISGYKELVGKLRTAFPGCAITTDIMTGFPGETDAEFNETLENLREIGFANIHIFPFSRRAGTTADTMPGQIPEAVKHARAAAVAEVAALTGLEFRRSMVGTVVNVLFEREKPDGNHQLTPHGFSENYTNVVLSGVYLAPGETYRNKLLPVRILSADGEGCAGELC